MRSLAALVGDQSHAGGKVAVMPIASGLLDEFARAKLDFRMQIAAVLAERALSAIPLKEEDLICVPSRSKLHSSNRAGLTRRRLGRLI